MDQGRTTAGLLRELPDGADQLLHFLDNLMDPFELLSAALTLLLILNCTLRNSYLAVVESSLRSEKRTF